MIKTGDMVKILGDSIERTHFDSSREWRVALVTNTGEYFVEARLNSTGARRGPFREDELKPLPGEAVYPFEDQIIEMARDYLGETVWEANRYRIPPFKLAEMIAHEMFLAENTYPPDQCIKKVHKCIIATLLQHMDKGGYFPSRGPKIHTWEDIHKFPWQDYIDNCDG